MESCDPESGKVFCRAGKSTNKMPHGNSRLQLCSLCHRLLTSGQWKVQSQCLIQVSLANDVLRLRESIWKACLYLSLWDFDRQRILSVPVTTSH